jgi:hypothetical protein
MALARAFVLCGKGKVSVCRTSEFSRSLATRNVVSMGGAIAGAGSGAESSPCRRRWCARSSNCHSTTPITAEAISSVKKSTVW